MKRVGPVLLFTVMILSGCIKPSLPPVVLEFKAPEEVIENHRFEMMARVSASHDEGLRVVFQMDSITREGTRSGEYFVAEFIAPSVESTETHVAFVRAYDENGTASLPMVRGVKIVPNEPPIITDLNAPDRVYENAVFTVRASVIDPNGSDDASEVHFEFNGSEKVSPLFDGEASITFQAPLVDHDETLEISAYAVDRNGERSHVVERSILIMDINHPPSVPTNPHPSDNAVDVPVNTTLSWTSTDPDGDVLRYDVYLGENPDPPLVKSDHGSNLYNPGTLKYDTTYYWKVVAKDGKGGVAQSPIWKFTTQPQAIINLSSKSITVGRVGYLEVEVVDHAGNPIESTDVSLEYYDSGTWKPLTDINGNSEVTTDSNGIATFALLGKRAVSLRIRASLSSNPSISSEAYLNFTKPGWIFFVYMAADNNLEPYAGMDKAEMSNTNPEVSVFVLFDSDESNSTTVDSFLVLDEDGFWIALERFSSDINSGDPNLLKTYLELVLDFEAYHYATIIWNHGSDWLLDSNYRAIAFDDSSDDALAVSEIREALQDALAGFGTLDILGMDACLMGGVEVAYELRNQAEYFVASASLEPAFGWNYTFLESLRNDDPVSVGESIVNAYFSYTTSAMVQTMGLFRTSALRSLAESLSSFGSVLRGKLDPSLRDRLLNYLENNVVHYGIEASSSLDYLIDLGDFLSAVYLNETDVDIRSSAEEVMNDLSNALVYYRVSGGYSSTKAMSIFLTGSISVYNYYSPDMNTLDFYTDPTISGWRDFLADFAQ